METLRHNIEPRKLIDEVTQENFYLGVSNNGNNTSRPIWLIKRIWKVGSVWNIGFPNGRQEFKFVWNDRYSYDYM